MVRTIRCRNCKGSGRERTALEIWDSLAWTLSALSWTPEQIARAREDVQEDEVLAGMPRWGGFEVLNPAGGMRTVERFRKGECS